MSIEDTAGLRTHEALYLRKWRDGEKERGEPPYEVIAYREVRGEDNELLDQWREVITNPADIRIIEAHVAASGTDIFSRAKEDSVDRKQVLRESIAELERLEREEVEAKKTRMASLREELAGARAYLKRKQEADAPNKRKIDTAKAQVTRIEGEIADLKKESSSWV